MLSKQKRRRFAQRVRGLVYRTHAAAIESEVSNPVIFVLDLRDRLACELAHSVMSGDRLAEQIESDTLNELKPLLVFALPPAEAASLIADHCKRLGDRLQLVTEKGQFRLVVVGYGGITCTKLLAAESPSRLG
jgi:hypothetical protein